MLERCGLGPQVPLLFPPVSLFPPRVRAFQGRETKKQKNRKHKEGLVTVIHGTGVGLYGAWGTKGKGRPQVSSPQKGGTLE